MNLTVLQVTYPFASVGPDPVGGAEQVLSACDRAVVAAGGRSLVIAPEGSAPAGELLTVPAVAGEITDAARAHVHAAVRARLAQAAPGADVVHLHGIDFDAYLPCTGPEAATPAAVSLHLPLGWYAPEALRPAREAVALVPVSARQAADAPLGVVLATAIENGVDVDAFALRLTPRRFHLALGRICPEKGVHLALDAAHEGGCDLLVAGEVFAYADHRRYFEAEVAPRLDRRRRWIGPVSGARKRRLLAAARGVLIASTAPETSSLVAREAAAAGAPVIALRSGALVDAVEEGVTGRLVDDAAGMARALAGLGGFDRAAIRARARARFPLRAMTDAYLDLYRRLAASRGADGADLRRPAA